MTNSILLIKYLDEFHQIDLSSNAHVYSLVMAIKCRLKINQFTLMYQDQYIDSMENYVNHFTQLSKLGIMIENRYYEDNYPIIIIKVVPLIQIFIKNSLNPTPSSIYLEPNSNLKEMENEIINLLKIYYSSSAIMKYKSYNFRLHGCLINDKLGNETLKLQDIGITPTKSDADRTIIAYHDFVARQLSYIMQY